jgi:Domain of unknown function (DUF1835)
MFNADAEIHIAPGPSAGGCLQAGLGLAPDLLLINHDLLSCGPLPPLESLDDWRDVRQAYLRSLDGEDPTFAFAEQDRDLLTNPDRLRAAGMITLWIGTGLAEQLLLVWVVAFLRRLGVDTAKFQTVQFDRYGKHEIVSVGVLNPSQFKDHPDPTKLDDAAMRELAEAWTGVTAPEPEALLTILAARERSLPFLQRSLFALLYRYPDLRTGLNAWEYQLLRYVREEGPKAVRVVGYTMAHDMDFPDWVGDSYLFHRLHRLADAALPRPLLTLSGETETLRGTTVHLTRDGEDVLAGNANAVDWNGIDDWIGGVHLDSRNGRVWFHKDETLVRGN